MYEYMYNMFYQNQYDINIIINLLETTSNTYLLKTKKTYNL